MKPLAPILLAALMLAGCNAPAPQAAAPAQPTIVVTPQDFHLPAGGSCSGEVARYRALQDNDLAMGHVAQSVYNQIKGEIAAAESECSAGHDAQARSLIVASKQRHGYPTGL